MSRNPNVGLYAVALAIAVVGVLWLGVPLAELAVLAAVLACPLMMILMMRGMDGGGGHGSDRRDDRESDQHRRG